jgi:hypothetical protein
MAANLSQRKSGLERLKAWIVGITGVLVVVPALVNAGLDIYASFANLPKTEAEATNEKLFKKYFNKQPVAAIPIPVKQDNGTVEVRFSIYDEGDVFVEFGKTTQWFRFPANGKPSGPSVASFLISSAYAQAAPATPMQGAGSYVQTDSLNGSRLTRERRYANGVTEKTVFETRSGAIVDRAVVRDHAPASAVPARTDKNAAKTVQIPTIDLDLYRHNRAVARAAGAGG